MKKRILGNVLLDNIFADFTYFLKFVKMIRIMFFSFFLPFSFFTISIFQLNNFLLSSSTLNRYLYFPPSIVFLFPFHSLFSFFIYKRHPPLFL